MRFQRFELFLFQFFGLFQVSIPIILLVLCESHTPWSGDGVSRAKICHFRSKLCLSLEKLSPGFSGIVFAHYINCFELHLNAISSIVRFVDGVGVINFLEKITEFRSEFLFLIRYTVLSFFKKLILYFKLIFHSPEISSEVASFAEIFAYDLYKKVLN